MNDWQKSSIESGYKYGYPKCCILEFINNSPDHLKLRSPNKIDYLKLKAAILDNHYTGFIPCTKHTLAILNKQIKLEDLINYTQRKSKYKFPNGIEFI